MDTKSSKRTNYNTKLVTPMHYLGIYFLITNLDPFIFFSTLILIFGIGDFFAIIQILMYLAPPIIGVHTVFFIFQTFKFSKNLKSALDGEIQESSLKIIRGFSKNGALNILSTNIGGPILTMVLAYNFKLVSTFGEVLLFSTLGILLAVSISSLFFLIIEKRLYSIYIDLNLNPLSLFLNILLPIFAVFIFAYSIISLYTYSIIRNNPDKAQIEFVCFALTFFILTMSLLYAIMVFRITSTTSNVILELASNLKSLSAGDLRHVPSKNVLRNEIGLIPIYINNTKDNLGKIFKTIIEGTQQLTVESSLLENVSRQASEHAENQASILEEAAAALEEYSASIEGIYTDSLDQQKLTKTANESINNLFKISSEVDSMSNKSKLLADSIINDVNKSSKSFEQALSSITEASENTKQISDILEIIKDISDQVNLLSLNASIEAARAGDSGKGFAVVASEVGKLADKTAHSTKTISELIHKVSVSTELSVHSVSTANAQFISLATNLSGIVKSIEQIHLANKNQIGEVSEIQTQAEQIVDRSNSVLTATGEQKRVNIEMGTTVNHLTDGTTKLSQMSEKTAHSSHKLNLLIQDLHQDLSKFIL